MARSSSPRWASSFTFASDLDAGAARRIDAHVRAFETIAAVPKLVVPGQAGPHRQASFYDPSQSNLRRDCGHYGTPSLPASRESPRDKAKVEQAA